jgi:hypothetical protein
LRQHSQFIHEVASLVQRPFGLVESVLDMHLDEQIADSAVRLNLGLPAPSIFGATLGATASKAFRSFSTRARTPRFMHLAEVPATSTRF